MRKQFDAFFQDGTIENDFIRLSMMFYQLLQESEMPKEIHPDEVILESDMPVDLISLALTEEFYRTEEGRELGDYEFLFPKVKKWFEYRCRFAAKGEEQVKALMCREFLYGVDNAEWADENCNITLFDSMAEAKEELKYYEKEENQAFEDGDIDEPFPDEFEIRLVLIENEETLRDVMNDKEYSRMQA